MSRTLRHDSPQPGGPPYGHPWRNGQIARLRDYVNVLAAAAAMGREI
jgi:hypothetical protein